MRRFAVFLGTTAATFLLLLAGVSLLMPLQPTTLTAKPVAITTPAVRPVALTPSVVIGWIRGRHLLWVNEAAYLMFERAADERDQRTLAWLADRYQYVEIDGLTSVTILKQSGTRVQVEVNSGSKYGDRGWTQASRVEPYATHR